MSNRILSAITTVSVFVAVVALVTAFSAKSQVTSLESDIARQEVLVSQLEKDTKAQLVQLKGFADMDAKLSVGLEKLFEFVQKTASSN